MPTAMGANAPWPACRFRNRVEQTRLKKRPQVRSCGLFSLRQKMRPKMPRTMIADLKSFERQQHYELKGWIRRIRETKSTTFIVLQDCSGTIQVVADPVRTRNLGLRAE